MRRKGPSWVDLIWCMSMDATGLRIASPSPDQRVITKATDDHLIKDGRRAPTGVGLPQLHKAQNQFRALLVHLQQKGLVSLRAMSLSPNIRGLFPC